MRKQWLVICITAGLLSACTGNESEQSQQQVAPQPAVCNGPVVEISGAEPRFEPFHATANQNYQRDGKNYQIVQDPSRFSQSGLAAISESETGASSTASGEMFDPLQLTAAHATLPIPSYARITNLANGRMIVVRINDRGPYGNDRVIALSRASADRLNTSNNSKVRIDPIIVAQDGTLSGPGTACTTIAQQTWALPARPDISTGMSSMPVSQPGQSQPEAPEMTSVASQNEASGMLSRNTEAQPQVVNNTPAPGQTAVPAVTQGNSPAEPVTAPAATQETASGTDGYVLQVGAVSDEGRARQFLQQMTGQYGVPGKISQNGPVYRIQLGPFNSKNEAAVIQQRLLDEAQQQSFITQATP